MEAAPGCANAELYCSSEKKANLWANNDDKQDLISIWRSIAMRYANETSVLGYDLIDAPNAPQNTDLESLYKDLINAIRQVDQNHIIFVQGNDKGTNFEVFRNRW